MITVSTFTRTRFVPEVWDLVKNTPLAATGEEQPHRHHRALPGNPQRLHDMDAQGIDYQAINVNAWGYSADRALARDLIAAAERKDLAVVRAASRIASSAWRRSRCSIPTSRPSSSIRRSGSWACAAPRSAAASKAQELSDRKFDPFWAKAEELGVHAVHASAARAGHDAEPAAAGQGRAGQHDRQSARDDRVPLAPDFRRHARSFPGSEDLRARTPAATWRRTAAGRMRCAAAAAAATTARRSRRSRASTSGASSTSTR